MLEYNIENDGDLLELANALGTPIPSRRSGMLIDNLTPINKEDAHHQSLSANFGVTGFPFHTDGAYFNVPPRYIILRYTRGVKDPTPTILCDLNEIDEQQISKLKYSIWKVRSSMPFYSSILSHDGRFYRFDTCIMKPINKLNDNSSFFTEIVSAAPKNIIKWDINKTVVIDNWRCLHSRPKVRREEINVRNLQRIMVL